MIVGLGFAGCAPKVLVLQSPVISMKQNNAGSNKNIGEGKVVEEKWCSNEDPVHANDDGSKHYGMIDQVVWRAHKSTNADFFVNTRFYQQGTCMSMTANVGQVASVSGDSAPAAEPASAPVGAPAHKAPMKKKTK